MSDNNILLIGNGFDLYHGLPTRYTDFLDFIELWDIFYNKYDYNKSTTMLPIVFNIHLNYNHKLDKDSMLSFARYSECFGKQNICDFNNSIKNNFC